MKTRENAQCNRGCEVISEANKVDLLPWSCHASHSLMSTPMRAVDVGVHSRSPGRVENPNPEVARQSESDHRYGLHEGLYEYPWLTGLSPVAEGLQAVLMNAFHHQAEMYVAKTNPGVRYRYQKNMYWPY